MLTTYNYYNLKLIIENSLYLILSLLYLYPIPGINMHFID